MANPNKNSVAVATMPGRNSGTLRRGNPGNQGGGRPSNALRIRAQVLLERAGALEILGKIVSGEILEPRGPNAKGMIKIRDRIRAFKLLYRIAYGAPRRAR